MLETRWHIIRHAPVENPEGKIYGTLDKSADTSDSAAFRSLASRLPQNSVSVVSHLKRTKQTLNALVNAGLKTENPIVESRLAEQDFGDWTGKTYDEAKALYGNQYNRFWLAPVAEKPPNGESFLNVIDRVKFCIAELNTKFKGQDVICIAHGGSIRAALSIALNLKAESAISFATDNLSITLIDYLHPETGFSGGWRVRGVNIPPI